MKHKDAKACREAASEQRRQDVLVEQQLQKWKLGTKWFGAALLASVAAGVPFLYGYPLHNYWEAVGKRILLLSMCLLCPFLYAAATTYNLWSYLRAMKEIHRKVPPTPRKKRTESRERHWTGKA